MTLVDTDRAGRPVPRARLGGRDERRLGGQHDVRGRQLRRPRRLHRQGQRRRARRGVRPRPPCRRRAFRPGAPAEDTPTGRCIIVVTPDAQRTMNTYLGVSSLLCADDIDEATIADGAVLYMEGYLFDRDDAKKAFRRAAVGRPRARSQGLADAVRLVLRRSPPRRLRRPRPRGGRPAVRQRGRAVLAVRGRRPRRRAIDAVRGDCALAVITVGQGRLARRDPRRGGPRCRPRTVSHVLDTTGAGDLYAAGFLYGYTQSRPLAECARLGSIAAAEVITHVGPRPLVAVAHAPAMTEGRRQARR